MGLVYFFMRIKSIRIKYLMYISLSVDYSNKLTISKQLDSENGGGCIESGAFNNRVKILSVDKEIKRE